VSKPPREARRKPKGICRSTHLNEKAQGFPELRSQPLRSLLRVIGHPAEAKAEVEIAGAERLSNQVEPLKRLFYFETASFLI
jgi:hypothetical protein